MGGMSERGEMGLKPAAANRVDVILPQLCCCDYAILNMLDISQIQEREGSCPEAPLGAEIETEKIERIDRRPNIPRSPDP